MGPCSTIVKFPKNFAGRATVNGASRYQIVQGRLQVALYRLFNKLGFPGGIKDMTITDKLTGQHIEIKVGVLFTRLSVNGRDYYFRRLSGRFDGTGYGCLANRPSCCTPDQAQQSTHAP